MTSEKAIFFVHCASEPIEHRVVNATKSFLNRFGFSSVDYWDWTWGEEQRVYGSGDRIEIKKYARLEASMGSLWVTHLSDVKYHDKFVVDDEALHGLLHQAKVIVLLSSGKQTCISDGVRHELTLLADGQALVRKRRQGITGYIFCHIGSGRRPSEYKYFEKSSGSASADHPILVDLSGKDIGAMKDHAFNAAVASLGAKIVCRILEVDNKAENLDRARLLCADRELHRMCRVDSRLAAIRNQIRHQLGIRVPWSERLFNAILFRGELLEVVR